jgi:hypothetical protein
VAILSSDRLTPAPRLAALLFARWAQENFFRYMMEHFSLDRMIEQGTEPIPETTRLTNPARRTLDSQIRSKNSLLTRRLTELGALSYDGTIAPAQIERFEQKKALLQEQIAGLKEHLVALKQKRAAVPTHIAYKDLPPDQRFERLRADSKHFIDTIKMIAYRAETAMANVLRDVLARTDDASELLRALLPKRRRSHPGRSDADPHGAPPSPRQPHEQRRPAASLRSTHRHRDGVPRHQPAPHVHFGLIAESPRSGGLSLEALHASDGPPS